MPSSIVMSRACPTLYIAVDPVGSDAYIENAYAEAATMHNNMIDTHKCPDAGFDVFCPTGKTVLSPQPSNKAYFLDFKIKCAMLREEGEGTEATTTPLSFYLYPRSSLSKTPFRLANSTGIIDSGYRGDIGGYFDVKPTVYGVEYEINSGAKLLQICAPTLEAFKVVAMPYQEFMQRFADTERGAGGFGSTGL